MEIYILRHGIAVERGTPGYKRDGDRPLTDEGVKAPATGLRYFTGPSNIIRTVPAILAAQ